MLIQTLQSVVASQAIIDYASWHLADALGVACPQGPPTSQLPVLDVTGAFVTLKRDGELRACFGTFGGHQPLREAVRLASIGTATRDTRFPPFSPDELEGLSVDVTVLFNYEKLNCPVADRPHHVEIGRHGLVIHMGTRSGLLLPQVAPEHQWDASTFLNHVCRKAGLPDQAWLDERADLFRFEGLVVPGMFQPKVLHPRLRHRHRVARPPAVAGSFYPGTARAITADVELLFPTEQRPSQQFTGLMVPHAGWLYSGRIAAQTLASVEIPSTVLIVGPKHTRAGKDWAVMPADSWEWPGGGLETDRELADRLVGQIAGIDYDSDAHAQEHAIEVELPLLAKVAPHCKVVGLVIGYASLLDCLELGAGLARVIQQCDSPPLIITSSDMNHFATDDENRRLDALALQALETLDPEKLYRTVVDEYRITMCGVRPAVIMLAALHRLGRLHQCHQVAYATSADVSGDTSRVVGYAGYRFW